MQACNCLDFQGRADWEDRYATILLTSMMVGALAGTASGVINVRLTADDASLEPGQTTTVRVWVQGTQAVLPHWAATSRPAGQPGCLRPIRVLSRGCAVHEPAPFSARYGSAGANGGWSSFGSQQISFLSPDSTYGRTITSRLPGIA